MDQHLSRGVFTSVRSCSDKACRGIPTKKCPGVRTSMPSSVVEEIGCNGLLLRDPSI